VALIAFAVALVVTLAATPPAMRLAARTGIVDRPGPLKVQSVAVPYLGGLAVLVGLAAAIAAVHPALLLPLGLAAVLGLLDDARDIPAVARLAGEVGIGAAGAAVVPVRWAGPFGPLAVVVAVMVLVNATNMLDGLDALAAGVAAIAAAGFAVVLHGDDRAVALALTGALAGFLWFNRPPARVYLGDAGSYLIGTALALLLAIAWRPHRPAALGIAGVTLVALPLLEAGVTIIRRLRAHHPLFHGDRGHVYDQLVDRGRSARQASLLFAGAELALCAIAVAVAHIGTTTAATVIAAAAIGGLLAVVVGAGFANPEFRREASPGE
jgi:UDP-GlcNAc:undecaprenyl-phosphate GlcNAc-1-phosphate transferase